MSFNAQDLVGAWTNDLGSTMNIKGVTGAGGPDGCFFGTYLTGVGKAEVVHQLSGGTWQFCLVDDKPCLLVLFNVQWTELVGENALPSCTCWSAQGGFNEDGTLCCLDSTYLLRRYTDAKNGWDQPVVNKNVFAKAAGGEEEV